MPIWYDDPEWDRPANWEDSAGNAGGGQDAPPPPVAPKQPGLTIGGAAGSEPSGGVSGDGGGGGDWGSYGGPMFPSFNLPSVPKFTAPKFAYQPFVAPDPKDLVNDPSYKFRLGQGEQALQNSAAGRGILRTGGTLKDILGYGQNFASQEYSNAWNRALQGYQTNYGVASDVFSKNYQGAKDEYAPLLAQYQNQVAAEMDKGKLGFQRAWDAYAFPLQLQNAFDISLNSGG